MSAAQRGFPHRVFVVKTLAHHSRCAPVKISKNKGLDIYSQQNTLHQIHRSLSNPY
jgi:hypothetical protein